VQKVVVTGGAGFIGSHISEALLELGYPVTILDDLSTGDSRNLVSALAKGGELVQGSILDEQVLERALSRADAVFHLAAIPSVPRSIAEPLLSHEVNSTGTLKLLEACRRKGVRRIIYAASTSAQGDLGDRPRSEAISGRPKSPYAVAKFTGELYGYVYYAIHGLEVATLRYFNVYGPRQRLRGAYTSVIPHFLVSGLRGEPVAIYGDGLQTRDFTYVADVVSASILALKSPAAPGRTINVCSGRSIAIRELADIIARVLGVPLSIRFASERAEDVRNVRGDPTLGNELLGFEARTSLEEGISKTAEWFRLQVGSGESEGISTAAEADQEGCGSAESDSLC